MDFVVRFCLALFPPAFRREFGTSIHTMVHDEVAAARRHGRAAGAVARLRATADLLTAAAAEWWRPTWYDGAGKPPARRDVMHLLEQAWRDMKQATRSLRRTPGFTGIAIVTLALAVGAATMVFAVVDTVLLRPLPFAQTDRLMYVAATAPGSEFDGEFGLFDESFIQVRDRSKTVQSLAFFQSGTGTVRIGERVERLRVAAVTWNFFETLGLRPIVGHLPDADDTKGKALLTYAIWKDWLGGDPNVIGRTYIIDGGPCEIIGVMGPDIRFPNDGVVAWLPYDIRPGDVHPGETGAGAVARLAPGATAGAAALELTNLTRQLPDRFGANAAYDRLLPRLQVLVRPLAEEIAGPAWRPLGVLFGATLILLAIACANIGNLFAVRSESRRHEWAVRQAIGARRGQIVRAHLAEVLIVGAGAGALAVGFALVSLPVFLSLAPTGVMRLSSTTIGPRVVLFTFVAALVAAVAAGLIPAWRASSVRAGDMRDASRSVTRRGRWGRDALLAGQTALALVLLVGSGLLLRSYARLSHVDPGYRIDDRFTFQIAPNQPHLTDGPSLAQFWLDFADRLRALPGVESVGIVENVPLDEGTSSDRFLVEGTAPGAGVRLNYTFAGPSYYETAGIRVFAGRTFTRQDAVGMTGNVIISRRAAQLLWPDADPIGRRLRLERFDTWETVIGVVDDVIQENWRQPKQATVYLPMTGHTPKQWRLSSPAYVVKTTRADSIAADIRAIVRSVAPEAPMYRAYTMSFLAARQMRDLSFTMLTLGLVSVLALVLGAIGLYGSLSYAVSQRTREIGVRLALGAQPSAVRRMVVRDGARIVAAGIAVGVGAALVAAPALGRLLFGVPPLDTLTFAGVAGTMTAVGLLASYLPARRASGVDPIVSLRSEG